MNLYITRWAEDKLWTFIDSVFTEIGGFGYIRKDDEGDLIWYETFVIPQIVSGASVDYSDESLNYAIDKAQKDGVLGQPDHHWMMWHSHANMGAYWSQTDEDDQIDMMRRNAGLPHLFSFVGNRKHEYKMRLDIFNHPLMKQITLEDFTLRAMRNDTAVKEAQADIDQNVEQKKWNKHSKKDKEKDSGQTSRNGEVTAEDLLSRGSSVNEDQRYLPAGDPTDEEWNEMGDPQKRQLLREWGFSADEADDIIKDDDLVIDAEIEEIMEQEEK